MTAGIGDRRRHGKRTMKLIRGGVRHWRHLRATDLYAVGSFDPDQMQPCASAAKLRAAGPFSLVGISAMFEYGFPPPRLVNSAVVLKSQRARRIVLSAMLVPVSRFRMLDARQRPPVTRQW